jgi:hypothetical protein
MMAQNYSEGTQVQWKWGSGSATGKVVQVFTGDVTKTIKGTDVTRNASPDDPAYLIRQDDGDEVLKGHSEVKKAS